MISVAQAGQLLERARFAAAAYAEYDQASVARIVDAVADAGYRNAERFAAAAVAETQMGVVEHKIVKNRACSRGIVEFYRDQDYVTPRIDTARKIVEIPARPASCWRCVPPPIPLRRCTSR